MADSYQVFKPKNNANHPAKDMHIKSKSGMKLNLLGLNGWAPGDPKKSGPAPAASNPPTPADNDAANGYNYTLDGDGSGQLNIDNINVPQDQGVTVLVKGDGKIKKDDIEITWTDENNTWAVAYAAPHSTAGSAAVSQSADAATLRERLQAINRISRESIDLLRQS